MSYAARITRDARREALPALLDFVEETCARAELRPDDAMAVRVAVEEVCTNVIAYGYAGGEPGPLSIEFSGDEDAVVVAVEDRGAPFDPDALPAPVLDQPWDERPVGGLGWHLVRSLMDEVRREPGPGGGNRVVLVKRRPPRRRSTPRSAPASVPPT